MKGLWYKVEYEGLHRICTNCGCYGHYARNCKREKQQVIRQSPSPAPAVSNAGDVVKEVTNAYINV